MAKKSNNATSLKAITRILSITLQIQNAYHNKDTLQN